MQYVVMLCCSIPDSVCSQLIGVELLTYVLSTVENIDVAALFFSALCLFVGQPLLLTSFSKQLR